MSKKPGIIMAMAGMLSASNDVYGAPLLPANRPREDTHCIGEEEMQVMQALLQRN